MSSAVTTTSTQADKGDESGHHPGHTDSMESGVNITQIDDLTHATAHKNTMSACDLIDEKMGNVTVLSSSNQSDHHNNDSTETHMNTNMTTNEGNGGHCITNEDCLGGENMDNCPDQQDQGKLRSKISKKCNTNQYIY